ncbi:hypothetical protein PQR66_19045 [Paraburkholderia agricolaris]|uniref:Uncharacterized protein n=1 Tax=Paraburkholderia agricolaris TaxID=2152888 RepID=A0ABW8ZPZ7_9BURK
MSSFSFGEMIAMLAALTFAFGTSLTVAIQSGGRFGMGLAMAMALLVVILAWDIKRRLTRERVDGCAQIRTAHYPLSARHGRL